MIGTMPYVIVVAVDKSFASVLTPGVVNVSPADAPCQTRREEPDDVIAELAAMLAEPPDDRTSWIKLNYDMFEIPSCPAMLRMRKTHSLPDSHLGTCG